MSTTIHRTDRRHGAAPHMAASLLDLANRIAAAANVDDACRRLADGVKELGELDTVAVGLASARAGRRIRAVTGLATIDPHAPTVQQWERSVDAALRDDAPHGEGTNASPWCVPIRVRGEAFATCVIVFLPEIDDAVTLATRHSFLTTALEILAPILDVAVCAKRRSAVGGPLRSLGRLITGRRRALLIAGLLVACCFLPVPWPIRCECQVEPQVRRTVAAPYNAIWRKSRVRPGDVVAVGQTLGLLDDAELQRELAAATADRDRAAKSADVNAAAGKTAAAQIDRLEVRRIEERRSLLTARLAAVEVKSPIAGIVLSGEWERAEGAPLKQGTVLYEIAPLDRVVVEALVPEADLDRLAPGSTTTVVLDARPTESRTATIERIHPRGEIHDDSNVFVAEIALDNTDGSLRPGMRGHVDVTAEPRSVARRIADRVRSFAWLPTW